MSGRFDIALDVNLLIRPSGRRLLHGLALELGFDLVVLPEVWKEAARRAGQVEAGRWVRRVRQHSPDVEDGVLDAVGAACVSGLQGILSHRSPPFRQIDRDVRKERLARDVAAGIPAEMIKVENSRYFGDPLIVGQAVAYGTDLISTNNFKSMAHEDINRWLKEKGRNADLLHTPDETIRKFDDKQGKWYDWMLAYGPWQPDASDEYDCRERFERARRVIDGTGFKLFAERVEWDYQNDRRFMDRVRTALCNPFAVAARETEAALNRKVQSAARKADWHE